MAFAIRIKLKELKPGDVFCFTLAGQIQYKVNRSLEDIRWKPVKKKVSHWRFTDCKYDPQSLCYFLSNELTAVFEVTNLESLIIT